MTSEAPKAEKLRIGMSACFFHADPVRPIFKGKTLLYLEQAMSHWVMSEGVLVYLIPEPLENRRAGTESIDLADLAKPLDGLILQGGSDVAPQSYGETPIRPEWKGDAHRDKYEIALLKEFQRQGKPVLGICRGAQLMNVALGGTLIQDIELQVPKAINHRNWEIYDQNFHDIEIVENSGLARCIENNSRNLNFPHPAGGRRLRINTIHHQAIKDLGKGLRVEAICPQDGVIEAIRYDGPDYLVAVQWHPEFQFQMNGSDPSLLNGEPILREFLAEAQKRKNRC